MCSSIQSVLNSRMMLRYSEFVLRVARQSGLKLGPEVIKKLCSTHDLLDLVNMNAYIKFSDNVSVSSRNIERKRNFGVNQGP